MADLGNFNAETKEDLGDFEVMPKGEYPAIAIASEFRETAAGNGNQYLQFEWEIIDGEYKGRRQWSRHNLINSNPKAVDIAEKELGMICKAVGIMVPKQSETLHGKPLVLCIDVEKRKDTGTLANRVKNFKPMNGAATVVSAPVKPAEPQQQTTPWGR